eukprot:IDg8702t1
MNACLDLGNWYRLHDGVRPHQQHRRGAKSTVRVISNRLEKMYFPLQIVAIGDQHKELFQAYSAEPLLKAAIDGVRADVPFSDTWTPLAQSYLDLENYCGGVATVFLGT